jgi:hypothetical protein
MTPDVSNVITLTASILGMILGTAGLTVSLMNYLRDRPKVKLSLQWDMTEALTKEKRGLIKVSNVGRRPVFISVVALALPKGMRHSHLLIDTSIGGKKLSEGDAPVGHTVSYPQLAEYSKGWRKIRAYAEDSTGRRYYSRFPPKGTKAPSWVNQ